jgi:DNA-binding response OmpR family regulator
LNRPHILIVDDDARYAELLSLMLRKSGYQVTIALDGEQALASAVNRPNLVILDIVMPGIDGFEVADRLESITGETTPFVFLTAKGLSHHRLTGLGVGAAEYITKPFHPDQLLQVVNNIFSGRREVPIVEIAERKDKV